MAVDEDIAVTVEHEDDLFDDSPPVDASGGDDGEASAGVPPPPPPPPSNPPPTRHYAPEPGPPPAAPRSVSFGAAEVQPAAPHTVSFGAAEVQPTTTGEAASDGSTRALTQSKEGGALWEGGDKLKVCVCSANLGNAVVSDLTPWIPHMGGGYDLVVVGMQESTYEISDELYAQVIAESQEQGTRVCPTLDPDDEELLEDGGEDDDARGTNEGKGLTSKMSIVDLHALQDAEDEEGDENEEGGEGKGAEEKADVGKAENTSKVTQFTSVLGGGKGGAHLEYSIENHICPQKYYLVASVQRLMMRIRVYARKELETRIHGVETGAENTGFLGGTIANKGGQAIKLVVDNTSLCFVSSHLAPHEGRKNCDARNANVRSIMEGSINWMGQSNMDLGSQYHHCFWMGDMNYRSDVPEESSWEIRSKDEKKGIKHELRKLGQGGWGQAEPGRAGSGWGETGRVESGLT